MKKLCINLGYWQLKSEDKKNFKTRMRKISFDDEIGKGINCDKLTYNNQTYVVGDGEVMLDYEKAENDFVKICVLNMLSRFTNNTETFKLLLTSPPLTYKNAVENYNKYLKGEYEVIHNGNDKKIIIEQVKVLPETFVAYLNNDADSYKNSNLMIIDVGGVTTNICLIKKGNFSCNNDYYITKRAGMYHLDSNIAQYLNEKYTTYNFDFDDDDIVDFRLNGFTIGDSSENIMKVEEEQINKIYDAHVKEYIFEACTKKKWNFHNYKVLVTGCGGKILLPTIQKYIPHAKSSRDPMYDNLEGIKSIVEMVL